MTALGARTRAAAEMRRGAAEQHPQKGAAKFYAKEWQKIREDQRKAAPGGGNSVRCCPLLSGPCPVWISGKAKTILDF